MYSPRLSDEKAHHFILAHAIILDRSCRAPLIFMTKHAICIIINYRQQRTLYLGTEYILMGSVSRLIDIELDWWIIFRMILISSFPLRFGLIHYWFLQFHCDYRIVIMLPTHTFYRAAVRKMKHSQHNAPPNDRADIFRWWYDIYWHYWW